MGHPLTTRLTACQPRLLKLQAAGFVRPAPLLGCSEKSPRQQTRAGGMKVDHPRGDRMPAREGLGQEQTRHIVGIAAGRAVVN
jgi:hypothetical protein